MPLIALAASENPRLGYTNQSKYTQSDRRASHCQEPQPSLTPRFELHKQAKVGLQVFLNSATFFPASLLLCTPSTFLHLVANYYYSPLASQHGQ